MVGRLQGQWAFFCLDFARSGASSGVGSHPKFTVATRIFGGRESGSLGINGICNGADDACVVGLDQLDDGHCKFGRASQVSQPFTMADASRGDRRLELESMKRAKTCKAIDS